MKVFITGGTGLLGGTLARMLLAQGHAVTILARSEAKAAPLAALGARVVLGDIEDVAGFAHALDGRDVLFHTAAYFREYFSGGDHWPKLKALNIDATIALLEEAERRGVKKVIYTSSSGVIGRHRTAAPPTKRCHPTHIPLKTSISKARCWPKKPLLTS